MPRQINQLQLFDTILAGVESAQDFYEQCSGGSWLWEAPESLICAHIAQSLSKLSGAVYVTLESNVDQTLSDAKAKTRGAPPKKLRSNGRFDLVVWWGGGTPRAAIEVKNQVFSYSQIYKDVERIESLVRRRADQTSFQFGAIVFYSSALTTTRCSAKSRLEKRLERFLNQTKAHVLQTVSVKLHQSSIHVIEDSAWVAGCIVLKYPASKTQ